MRVGGAMVVFLVFGALAVAMGRTALNDWREGTKNRDALSIWAAVETLWPTVLAAAVALLGPIIILAQG